MDKIIDKEYCFSNKEKIIEAIKMGKIFIYPTDTIYGIGTNALIEETVVKVREIKERDEKPFSIIIPDINFVFENCAVNREAEEKLKLFPGPYTFFLSLKNKNSIATAINPQDNNQSVGVRIPDVWFTEFIKEANVPFVTTSVNKSGESYMTNLENLDKDILEKVDYIIYEGKIDNGVSQKFDLRNI